MGGREKTARLWQRVAVQVQMVKGRTALAKRRGMNRMAGTKRNLMHRGRAVLMQDKRTLLNFNPYRPGGRGSRDGNAVARRGTKFAIKRKEVTQLGPLREVKKKKTGKGRIARDSNKMLK